MAALFLFFLAYGMDVFLRWTVSTVGTHYCFRYRLPNALFIRCDIKIREAPGELPAVEKIVAVVLVHHLTHFPEQWIEEADETDGPGRQTEIHGLGLHF